MTTPLDVDLALLAGLTRQHTGVLPARTLTCLSAAADELTDPLTPPPLPHPGEAAGMEPAAVIAAVRDRLVARAQVAMTVSEAMACARAARELGEALRSLLGTGRQ